MHERLRFLEQYNVEHHTANVSSATGALLLFLARLVSARCILEVGTSTGYSTLWLAPAGAEGHTPERGADRAAGAPENFSSVTKSSFTLRKAF